MKAIKRKNAYGMGGTFDQPGYEYDPVNDTFKDIETGKVFSKEYVAPTSGSSTGTGASTIKLEPNKAATIDVSQYTEPVVITPTEGKDGMEQTTVTLSNITSGSVKLYYWTNENGTIDYYTNFDKSPATQEELNSKKYLSYKSGVPFHIYSMSGEIGDYQKVSDTEFSGTWDGDPVIFHHYPTYDITLWEISS